MTDLRDQDRLRVNLGTRGYDIIVGPGVVTNEAAFGHPPPRFVVVLTDDHVAPLHLESLCAALTRHNIDHDRIIVPHGETSKSFACLRDVCDRLLSLPIDRHSALLAFGGGVVGDLAGFAASIVLRGVDYFQIPTTLLAQVDSAIGGKTGINAAQGKNLIGTFHHPRAVLSDPTYLDTLPQREMQAGYAEIVKYGLIADADFFSWLETHGTSVCQGDKDKQITAILRSCRIKADIVAEDERESGPRALLNLGHTFGHALETAAGYTGDLLHGEAVSIGMNMAFDLATRLGMCAAEDHHRVGNHLRAVGLPTAIPATLDLGEEDFLKIMARDKKNRGSTLRFILPRKIGSAVISDTVPPDVLRGVLLQAINGESHG